MISSTFDSIYVILFIVFDWKISASDMRMPTAAFIDVYSTVKNWMNIYNKVLVKLLYGINPVVL